MKKSLILLLSAIFVGLALNVQASNVSFSPNLVRFQVAPGQADKADVSVNAISSMEFMLFIKIGSRVNGNLPASWFRPVMLNLLFGPDGTSSSAIELGVSVPPDAMAGTYSGVLMPEAIRSREPVSSRGLFVVIEVIPQNACSASPVFENVEIGPQEIWAPADRDVDIHISGSVAIGTNCDVSDVSAGFSFEGNTGLITGELLLDEQGNFAKNITVNVSRSGKDKEGRIYSGTLFAEDGEGNDANMQFFVTVVHDKGKKNGHNK